jgi:uncharacterized metal-binding protein
MAVATVRLRWRKEKTMDEMDCNCAKCLVVEKLCRSKNGVGPAQCPTKKQAGTVEKALKEYDDPDTREFARMASIQEGSCYAQRDAKPFVPMPTKTRLEEIIEFSRRMGYRRLGVVFCGGLSKEAAILTDILEKHGFEIVSVCCKVGGIPKERIGVKDTEKVKIGEFEPMCNPIAQAKIINEAKTDFNILMGLCVGHDSLFLKFVEGLTTVFAVKDRVTVHNPIAVLYNSDAYYRRFGSGKVR